MWNKPDKKHKYQMIPEVSKISIFTEIESRLEVIRGYGVGKWEIIA